MKQKTGLSRNIIDKYYTSNIVVKKCINLIKKNIKIENNHICIEPSAGNGAFINEIKLLFNNYKFYDLEPEHKEIIKQNYLDLNFNKIIKKYNKIHIIGNPPFGRQSSSAIKFIKLSCKYCNSISFILPKSFKKNSMKKYFPLNFHLICEYDLPEYSFIVNEKSYNVPCVFQIWIKKKNKRKIPKKLIPKKYNFVKKCGNPDICFRRIGVYAGNIFKDISNKSEQSHYFIKFDNELTKKKYIQLSKINYPSKNNTTGPKSISKQELIKEFNKIIN